MRLLCLAAVLISASAAMADSHKVLSEEMQQTLDAVDDLGAVLGQPSALDLLMAQTDNPPDLILSLTASDGVWTAKSQVDTPGLVTLPLDAVVALQITSADLIYEMAFPLLDIKFDAIPGRIAVINLKFSAPGRYEGVCTAPCGAGGGALTFDVRPAE